MDNVTKMNKFLALAANDNFLRLIVFGIVGIGLIVTMFILQTKDVKWINKEEGKVRGHTFAFVASYLFVCFLFLGFIFDFIATSWVKMGEWILYGYATIMALFTTTNVVKNVAGLSLKKAEIFGKIPTIMKGNEDGKEAAEGK